MTKPIILLDCDGVLCDFVGGVIDVLGVGAREDFTSLYMRDVLDHGSLREVEEAIRTPGWCYRLEPYDGAFSFVKDLKTWADVQIVTTPYLAHSTWCDERLQWLGVQMGVPNIDVTFTHWKQLVHGDVLVEDSLDNIEQWQFRNRPLTRPIVIDQPWNRITSTAHYTRVPNLQEAYEVLESRYRR